jgi:rubrerythrin
MQLQTASQVINFAVELEDKSAKFYEDLAEKFKQHREIFLSFVKENKKNKLLVQRVYNEVVSDALETGFSFEDLGIDDYLIEINLAEDISLPDVLKKALDIEAKIERFYLNAAKKSKSFLADVPRVFEKIGKKRDERKEKLKSLW